jgi:hypothetical protein
MKTGWTGRRDEERVEGREGGSERETKKKVSSWL